MLGWDAVTVPGAVDAWTTLSRRFGKLPFSDLFEPAIHYARDGFAVSPITAHRWAENPREFASSQASAPPKPPSRPDAAIRTEEPEIPAPQTETSRAGGKGLL